MRNQKTVHIRFYHSAIGVRRLQSSLLNPFPKICRPLLKPVNFHALSEGLAKIESEWGPKNCEATINAAAAGKVVWLRANRVKSDRQVSKGGE